jgi:hypothetical protein
VKLRKLHFIQIQSGHYFIIIFVITFRCWWWDFLE